MAKTRTYKRDLQGRFAPIANAAARRVGRRPAPRRSSTSLGFSAGLIEARGVKLQDASLTVSRTSRTGPVKPRRTRKR